LEEYNPDILCNQLNGLADRILGIPYIQLSVLVVHILAILYYLRFVLVHRHLGKQLLEVFLLELNILGIQYIQLNVLDHILFAYKLLRSSLDNHAMQLVLGFVPVPEELL
jgi:hypothetical protein